MARDSIVWMIRMVRNYPFWADCAKGGWFYVCFRVVRRWFLLGGYVSVIPVIRVSKGVPADGME